MVSIFASGNIKGYQISLITFFLLGLVLIFIILNVGAEPYSVSIVAIIIQIALLSSRLFFAKKHIGVSIKLFSKEVVKPILLVSVLSILISFSFHIMVDSILTLIISVTIDVTIVGVTILTLGIEQNERKYIINLISQRLRK